MEFSKTVIQAYGDRILEELQPDVLLMQLEDCWTIRQFDRFFESYLLRAAKHIDDARDRSDPIVDYVTDYIKKHLGEDLSLELLADQLRLSAPYLSTYFKENSGVTFSEYLNACRMSKAEQLLEDTELMVQDIALQVGYLSVNSFIRNFKKQVGVPPGKYRERKR